MKTEIKDFTIYSIIIFFNFLLSGGINSITKFYYVDFIEFLIIFMCFNFVSFGFIYIWGNNTKREKIINGLIDWLIRRF